MANSKRAGQREAHRPRHRLEEPAFDGLQSEDRQVRSNDDAAGKENRPLHFVCCVANPLRWAEIVVPVREWRTMFSIITTDPSTTMPKSSAPSESRLAGT